MALPPETKKLVKEDFKQEDHELIDRIAFSLNPFMEQVTNAFTKQIDLSNLAMELKEFTVTTNLSAGSTLNTPKQILQLATSLTYKVRGIICVRAQNLTDATGFVSSTPMINFVPNGQILNILHVTGLPALSGDPTTSQTFKLTVLLIT